MGDDSPVTIEEIWLCDLLSDSPDLPEGFTAPSTFFSNDPEIISNPSLREAAYIFRDIDSWCGIGLQILVAFGWRPDCAQKDSLSVARILPPSTYPEEELDCGRIS